MHTFTHLIEKLKNTRIQIWIIICFTLLAYGNIFANQFVWDDTTLIVNWPEIQHISNIPKLFALATNPNFPDTYRPVRFVFGIVLYQLFGAHTFGYHLIILFIHLGITLCIYLFVKRLTSDSLTPFVTSLLFGVHPIHTEAITWMSSGIDMLGILFVFGAILFLLKEKLSSPIYVYVSLLFALLGYFSLELSVVLPALLILIIFILKQKNDTRLSYTMVVPYILLAFLYLYFRWHIIGIKEVFNHVDGKSSLTMLTMARALEEYFKLLIVPLNLTIDHALGNGITSFMVEIAGASPTVLHALRAQRITDPPVLLSIGILISSILIGFLYRKKQPLITLALAWFFLTLLPVSNIIPAHTLMAERYLYLPSFGFCLLIALGISHLIQSKMKYRIIMGFVVVTLLTCSYTVLTLQRNTEWKTSLLLWTIATKRNPTSYIAYAALGRQYLERGENDKAIALYENILTFDPEHKSVIGSLAQIYDRLGNHERALELVQKAIQLTPNDSEAWIKLGDIYGELNRNMEAQDAFRHAQKLYPDNPLLKRRLKSIL